MLLEQIERKQREAQKRYSNMSEPNRIPTTDVDSVDNGVPRYKTADAHSGARLPDESASGGKTVAIQADKNLYEQLQAIQRRYKTRGVRGALILAARKGIEQLLR